jgi:hypothetical protein
MSGGFMRGLAWCSGLAAAMLLAGSARAEPADNWADLRAALAACWTVPPGTEGSLIAFRFGLDRTGALRGRPLVTARRLAGDREAGRRYEDAAFAVLSRCLPVAVTPGFGAVLGESPVRLRFVNTKPTEAYQLNGNITLFAPEAGESR